VELVLRTLKKTSIKWLKKNTPTPAIGFAASAAFCVACGHWGFFASTERLKR
jgi:hypothetical protein